MFLASLDQNFIDSLISKYNLDIDQALDTAEELETPLNDRAGLANAIIYDLIEQINAQFINKFKDC